MSRAFAMWVEAAVAMRVRGPQFLLSGSPLGRAPEVRDALHMLSPFSARRRIHCTSLLGQPRGASDMRFTLGIDGDLGLDPRQCIGAVIVEEGVIVRAFSACLRQRVDKPYHAPARFDLGRDRAWGLIAVRGRIVNIVVVGGGLAAAEDFWPSLRRIEPQTQPALDIASFERVSEAFEYGTGVWQLPTIRTYARGEWERALVLRSSGPVTMDSAPVFVDGALRHSVLHQQPEGLTQLLVEGAPGMDVGTVVVRMAAA